MWLGAGGGEAEKKKQNPENNTHTHTKNPTWSGGNLTCARVAEFGSLQTFAESWLDFTGKKKKKTFIKNSRICAEKLL